MPRPRSRPGRVVRAAVLSASLLLLAGLAGLAAWEIATSSLQARAIARFVAPARFQLERGRSVAILFPSAGPYDLRLGYADLPRLVGRLEASGYAVASQSVWSDRLLELGRHGLYPPYREKDQAGLVILGRDGGQVHASLKPARVYREYEEIPRAVVGMLMFIENRGLLEDDLPRRNPALDWDRLLSAVLQAAEKKMRGTAGNTPGASTLATQIEKFRHSPGGRTGSPREKLRQMASASLRAYLEGEDTRAAARRIMLAWLNTLPVGGVAGVGEVHGLGDALWAWYGTDFDEANRLLREAVLQEGPTAELPRQAAVFRQVLSLLIAQRRPGWFLGDGRGALDTMADRYAGLLVADGEIPVWLAEAVIRARLSIVRPEPPRISLPAEGKAVVTMRNRLMTTLGLQGLYQLDRLDLSVESTLDGATQAAVANRLAAIADRELAGRAGLLGPHLIGAGDPGEVLFSLTLYERVGDANLLRLQTDMYDGPFSLNEGMKLELGSTAKLRTLVSYLELVAELHARLSALGPAGLGKVRVDPGDRLGAWAVGWLAGRPRATLAEMLTAAMARPFSADPDEGFFTGGGLHRFENFRPEDDRLEPDVSEALAGSVNLSFIRIMHEVVGHLTHAGTDAPGAVLRDRHHPRRREFLARFADIEGTQFLERFWGESRGRTPAAVEAALLDRVPRAPRALSAAFLWLHPDGTVDHLRDLLRARLGSGYPGDAAAGRLFSSTGPDAVTLADAGAITRLHPLELWLASYLLARPDSTFAEAKAASADARQASYAWLFRTTSAAAQQIRIRTVVEHDAFRELHRRWTRLGYPFPFLVPSLATAIGSSGDRPSALAELVGIIQNGGLRLPVVSIRRLSFATGTPYETNLVRSTPPAERVLAPEVASAAREALEGVVERGTARRLHGLFTAPDGSRLRLGGKTGTGDNRMEQYDQEGRMTSSRAINRTATFAFYAGDHWFGVITAYVPGQAADRHRFTSSLVLQTLRHLAPAIQPMLTAPPGGR